MPSQKIPYPPSPTDVPEGFTDYSDSFTKKQNVLLAGLFVFLILYIAMVIFFAMVGVWCALTFAKWPIVKIVGLVMSGIFFLYLVKGFFKRPPMNKETHIEIKEKDQPVLFGFIDQLCEELGAPLPNKVFISPDVNAACMSRTSLINLFVEPKRDLLIGLGLVNCMNLSEFKAVLAHEFGHFCHLGPANSYTIVVHRIIINLVDGEDWFDRIIYWCKRQKNVFSIFGFAIGGCLWLGRKILVTILNLITLQALALSREQEFHADKVAVSAAGSDASTHGLLRARFGMQCFIQAINDLVAPARDHKLYTNDLYLHQDRAAPIVRRQKKEAELGLPPALPTPTSGKNIKVFDAEQDELEDEDTTPPMWRTHPADAEREENAKKHFIPALMDHRSPWILFTDVAELKERMTYKFYRMEFRIPKDSDLTDAPKIQEYIDNEHAETTYDPKYHGAYDDRPLEPGDLSELYTIIHDSPWTEDRMMKVYEKLYEGCKEHAEEHADLHKELQSLQQNVVGKPSPKMKKMIEATEKKLDTNWEWFKSFDRRVYLLHVQMAAAVDNEMRKGLIERYQFQLEVQRFYQEARRNFNKADAYISAYGAAARGEIQVPDDFGAEVIAVLRAAWKALKKIVQDARDINLPAMKNFEEGERLADFILEGKMVPEPPLTELKGVWVQKLMNQLQGVKNRCFRLHFKSVGGVLAMQEKIAAAWLAAREPIAAEVIAAEVIEPEIIPAEVIPAEVIEDVIPAEVIPIDDVAEPLPLDAIPAEVIPSAPAPAEPTAKPMAAFVTAPQHSPMQAKPASATQSAIPSTVISPPAVQPVWAAPDAKVPEPLPLAEEEPIAATIQPPQPTPMIQTPTTATFPPAASSKPLSKITPVIPPREMPATAETKTSSPVDPVRPISETETEPVPAEVAKTDPSPAFGVTSTSQTAVPATTTRNLPSDTVGQILAADLAASPSPKAVEFFSLDAATFPTTEKSSPPSAQPTEEIFSLDADFAPAQTEAAKPQSTGMPVPVEEVFSLDADDAAVKPQSTDMPIPIEEVFSLDADEAPVPGNVTQPKSVPQPKQPVEVVFSPGAGNRASAAPAAPAPIPTAKTSAPTPPKPTPAATSQPTANPLPSGSAQPIAYSPTTQPVAKSADSGTATAPKSRPVFGSAATSTAAGGSADGIQPRADGKRPVVKITLVKPGDKSPFAV